MCPYSERFGWTANWVENEVENKAMALKEVIKICIRQAKVMPVSAIPESSDAEEHDEQDSSWVSPISRRRQVID